MVFNQTQQMNPVQQMADYIRNYWQNCIVSQQSVLPQQVQVSLMQHLNSNIGAWANALWQNMCAQPGQWTSQMINQTILTWFTEAKNRYSSSFGFYPQPQVPMYPQVPVANPGFGGMSVGMGGGMMGQQGGFGGAPAMMPMGGTGSVLDASNQMYSGTPTTVTKVELPQPVTPMSNLPQQTSTEAVTKPAESIKASSSQDLGPAYKLPNCTNHEDKIFKLPIAGKGYIETYKIQQGLKTSKKLFIELDKFTDDIKGVLNSLKKKFNYDQIVIKYRSFKVVKANLAELQSAFIELKEILSDEEKSYEDITTAVTDLLNSKTVGVTKQVESIVLDEYNNVIKHFELDTPVVKSLDELFKYDESNVCYVKAALDLIKSTMIYDPASTEMSSYLGDYEVEEGKTYKDLRKTKEKFVKWAKNNAVVVSHPQILRYTKIFDLDSNNACLIASGDFAISVTDNGAMLTSDFEYFLNDEIVIDSSLETMLIQNGGSVYEVHLARMNQDDGAKVIKYTSLRSD